MSVTTVTVHIHCPSSKRVFLITLTLSGLSLGDPLSDDPAGVVDGRGGLKLHRLHHIALADADLQRQHHHLGGQCGRALQLHLREQDSRGIEFHNLSPDTIRRAAHTLYTHTSFSCH